MSRRVRSRPGGLRFGDTDLTAGPLPHTSGGPLVHNYNDSAGRCDKGERTEWPKDPLQTETCITRHDKICNILPIDVLMIHLQLSTTMNWGRYMYFRRLAKGVLVLLASSVLMLGGVSSASAIVPATAMTGTSTNGLSAPPPAQAELSTAPKRVVPPDTANPDDVAGQYYSFCIWWNGTSALWTNNDPYACQGWLDVYINGQHVAHLQNGGKPLASISCQLGVATGVIQVFTGGLYSGWGLSSWLWSSWVTGLGCR